MNYPADAQLVLPKLIKLLQELNDATDRECLAGALGAAGTPALPHVIEATRHANPAVRRCALEAINFMGRKGIPARAAVPALVDRITDEDHEVAWAAFEAIGAIGPGAEQAVPALIKYVQTRSGRLRVSAVYALWCIGARARDAVPTLVSVLRDFRRDKQERDDLRLYCLFALYRIGPAAQPAVPVLVDLLRDNSEDLRVEHSSALNALGEIGVSNEQVLAAVTAHLDNPDTTTRIAAAASLWQLDRGNAKALDVIIKELKNPDDRLRGDAALALTEFGPLAKAALPALRLMLAEDPEIDNRSFAEMAIVSITADKD
jgi:HEAT repeat protein